MSITFFNRGFKKNCDKGTFFFLLLTSTQLYNVHNVCYVIIILLLWTVYSKINILPIVELFFNNKLWTKECLCYFLFCFVLCTNSIMIFFFKGENYLYKDYLFVLHFKIKLTYQPINHCIFLGENKLY